MDPPAPVAAHLLHDVFHDAGPALFRVEVELLDDPLEPRAAHDLLRQRLQPILDARRHGRPHVCFRHALRYDENDCL